MDARAIEFESTMGVGEVRSVPAAEKICKKHAKA